MCLKWDYFLVHNRKSEHQHRIQQIQVSADAKFHLKQTSLIVLDKFSQKGRKNLAYRK